jgi:hypothetical protein
MLRGLQLRFGNKVFPERGTQTNSGEYLRLMIENGDFDGALQCTEAFENSVILPPQTKAPFRGRDKADNTCFPCIFPVERKSANAFFFDTVNNPSETISLIASSIVANSDQDTYLYNHRHNNTNTDAKKNVTPPIICFVSDTFWLFALNKPAIYEISKTWNQVFKDNYPVLYNTLLSQANINDPTLGDY